MKRKLVVVGKLVFVGNQRKPTPANLPTWRQRQQTGGGGLLALGPTRWVKGVTKIPFTQAYPLLLHSQAALTSKTARHSRSG